MALSRDLLKRLNSDDEPLSKRLKLAKNVYCKVDIPFTRKDILLQWLCETGVTDQTVWRTLQTVLQTNDLNVKNDIKELLINTFVCKLLNETEVPNKDEWKDILECCIYLFKHIGIQQYFINKSNHLGQLSKAVLMNIFKRFKLKSKIDKNSTDCVNLLLYKDNKEFMLAYNVVENIMESILQIYKNGISVKEKLRFIFINDILFPLCALVDYKLHDRTNTLSTLTYKCIQQIIFAKVRYPHSNNEEDKIQYTELFSVLKANANLLSLQRNSVTCICVFQAAVQYYKAESSMIDFIFRTMLHSVQKHKQQVLNSILPYLYDITFDFDNKINELTLSEYIQALIDDILLRQSVTTLDYAVLTKISHLNPLVFEKKLQDILKKIFAEETTIEYSDFIISILEVSVRLRQSHKLPSQLLMALKETCTEKVLHIKHDVFPCTFKDKFTQSIINITVEQRLNVMRTFVFHLSTHCMDTVKDDESSKKPLVMKATIELLNAYLDGVCIFESNVTMVSHQKFMDTFYELGNSLSALIEKALCLSYNENIFISLLTGMCSWYKMHYTVKYYIPKAIKCKLSMPITEDQWKQLIERVKIFGNASCKDIMNKLILCQFKTQSPIKRHTNLNALIGGLERSWQTILKDNSEILSFLTNDEISQTTFLLLSDITTNTNSADQWIPVLKNEHFQENRTFIISFLIHILTHIGMVITASTSKCIINYINYEAIMHAEINKSVEIVEVLNHIKGELSKSNWTQIDGVVFDKVEVCLKLLLHLPLMELKSNIKTLLFLVIYAISVECKKSCKIVSLCNNLLSDFCESASNSINQYLNSAVIITQLSGNKALTKVFEHCIRSITTYAEFKNLIKSVADSKESAYTLLLCISNVKSKLHEDQKPVFRKVEKKLSRMIFTKMFDCKDQPNDIQILTLLLKTAISKKKLDENLKNAAESTLCTIFPSNDTSNEKRNIKLMQETLQLATIVLQNQKLFNISNSIIEEIWRETLKTPYECILLPLIACTETSVLQKTLKCIHDQMITDLSDKDENSIKNIFTIWNAIIKTDMSTVRNKHRLAAIENVFQVIQVSDIAQTCWPYFLKFFHSIMRRKHFNLPDSITDMCVHSSLKSLDKSNPEICNDVIILYGIILKTKINYVTDRLSLLLLLYRRLVNTIVRTSKIKVKTVLVEKQFRCLALDMEKLTTIFIKLKKDIIRITPYIIADFLELLTEGAMPPYIKDSLENVLAQLISVTDQHGRALLSRTLSTPLQEVFKVQLEIFKKFYKFTGKI